jgi:hypothetical protein
MVCVEAKLGFIGSGFSVDYFDGLVEAGASLQYLSRTNGRDEAQHPIICIFLTDSKKEH